MMKIMLSILIIVLLSGCSIFTKPEPRVETVYKEVKVPISNVPMPPNTDCPKPLVEKLSKEESEDDGLVAKAYRISIEQLRDCSILKEKVINKYRDIAKEDAEKIDNFEQNSPFSANQGGNNTLVIQQVERQGVFNDIEDEFEALKSKEYDIE